MVGERVQLYKIRRLVAPVYEGGGVPEPPSHYEYVKSHRGPIDSYDCVTWTSESIDAESFIHRDVAVRICERLKCKNRDPAVLYHAVVPV